MRPDPDTPLGRLYAAPVRAGEVAWIGLRPTHKGDLEVVQSATLVAERGLKGDHYGRYKGGQRQVTLIAEEDLAAAASFLGAPVGPEQARRNIMTRGVNLGALKDCRFRLGGALLEYTGECDPCGRMESALGVGGFNALRGRGGITAIILEGGDVRVGDAVVRVD